MPDLEKLNNEFDDSEFRFIGIVDDVTDKDGTIKPAELETAKQIVEERGATFPMLILDKDAYAFIKSSITATPTTMFVDSNGNIIDTVVGGQTYEAWKDKVNEVLGADRK